ncbi:MAG: TIGR00270 family protein [Nitrososphaerota archaeon]|nr:TIGR00270 family protein [Nitrososphaerota archaeon]MDG6940176.1 TIGR00270 family protein [Nitrososphaerota archaeon]
MSRCEVCGGASIEPVRVEIDGATMLVCARCSKLGKPAKQPVSVPAPKNRPAGISSVYRRQATAIPEDGPAVREDFAEVIRNARESMNLTQEQFGMKLNEKSSVVAKLESGKLKPNVQLAKKLEHTIRVRLFEEPE